VPKDVVIAQSVASRPVAISTRPDAPNIVPGIERPPAIAQIHFKPALKSIDLGHDDSYVTQVSVA